MISYKIDLQRPDNPILDEYIREYEDKAKTETKQKIAKAMLKEGIAPEIVAECTSLPIETITKLEK